MHDTTLDFSVCAAREVCVNFVANVPGDT